ncbi:SMI1/KNR4 family protein [Flavobacterium sp. '19STA2R22 D10 B1']|uniref:SMI1/KNR4 family protein n=1 Tax=Flavobacterium aerium TaxID=3037261 RepID=UPI00278C59ED|nr:SMI1/KNR4 family protein [Flavobacterium sp. '19STA2R22 D10 B1']
MSTYFKDFDFSEFWDDNSYALNEYLEEAPTDEMIASIEKELGYKLPASYIELMKMHNGGIPVSTSFPTEESTSWAEDHIAICGISGIGKTKTYSLGGVHGSRFWIEQWEYPDYGVYICDCPSAGHDMILLDYRKYGKNGEPQVVHVDQENDYKITFLAENFEAFIRGLIPEDDFDTADEDYELAQQIVLYSSFTPLVESLCEQYTEHPKMERIIRNLCSEILIKKGYFALYSDKRSVLLYDLHFLLYTNMYPIPKIEDYLEIQNRIYDSAPIVSGEFFAPEFSQAWFNKRIEKKQIIPTENSFAFTEEFKLKVLKKIKPFQ